jgi:hypothetical protein
MCLNSNAHLNLFPLNQKDLEEISILRKKICHMHIACCNMHIAKESILRLTYICWYQNVQIPIIHNGHASTRIGVSTRTGTCPYRYKDLYLEMRHHPHFLLF